MTKVLLLSLFQRWLGAHQAADYIPLLSIAGKILARNNRHDLHSTTASRKMPGTECGPLHDLCRHYQSIWHSQS